MHSSIHQYTAAQRHEDVIRAAQRNPVLARELRPRDEPTPRRSRVGVFARSLARPLALRTANHRS